MHSVGSRAELRAMSPNYEQVAKKYAKEMDASEKGLEVEMHRPFIDDVVITCPKCGKEIRGGGSDQGMVLFPSGGIYPAV